MKICSVENCGRKHRCKGLCGLHYNRLITGKAIGGPDRLKAVSGAGHINRQGYREFQNGSEHILIAERVLGRKLPINAVIHHVDGNGLNNYSANLVICQDQNYHVLLHQRQRALDQCGRADWLKCVYCKRYDSPENLYIRPGRNQGFHRACCAKDKRDKRHAKML